MDSKRFYWLFFILVAVTKFSQVLCNRVTYPETNEEDAHILLNCLEVTASSDSILKKLEKVTRYSQWGEEEVPCFTRCLAIGKLWFNQKTDQWNLKKLVDDLGADVYNYCRYELETRNENIGACLFAYKGLKCLKQAEHYTVETYSTLLDCANALKANLTLMQQYAKFPKTETVPCLFKCFADQMNLYNVHNEPDLENWFRAFGPPKRSKRPVSIGDCKQTNADESEICNSMYRQYMCLENKLYDSHGEGPLNVVKKVAVDVTTTTMATEMDTMDIFESTTTAFTKPPPPHTVATTTTTTTTTTTSTTTSTTSTTTTTPAPPTTNMTVTDLDENTAQEETT